MVQPSQKIGCVSAKAIEQALAFSLGLHYLCTHKEILMNVRCILYAIEEFAPWALQESYDNAGLQTGDDANDCTGVLLTLDVTERTVAEAVEGGFNLIISHHPLLFKGVKSITPSTATGRNLMKAISNGISIYAAHTNLDNARGGVSFRMAEKVGARNLRVLQPQQGRLSKLVVFVPSGYADAVSKALFDNGAGCIGNYDSCSYTMEGEGSFRAGDSSNPFVGAHGELHRGPERRIEVIIPTWRVGRAVSAMVAAHPYEEPAYDVIPLANADRYAGSGVIGDIDPINYGVFIERLKSAYGTPCVRCSGRLDSTVSRGAFCGGSGAFLVEDAIAAGADAYVTGDVKYHDFTGAAGRIRIADVGHYESEQCAKEIFSEIIRAKFPNLRIVYSTTDINPINYI